MQPVDKYDILVNMRDVTASSAAQERRGTMRPKYQTVADTLRREILNDSRGGIEANE